MSVAMKRKSDNDEASSASKKPPRQDPVSCQTCRKRKLKCDRKSPCGSCSARRLQCLYASPTSENVQTRRIENIESPAKAQNLGDVVRESHPSPTREQVPSAIVPPSIGTREKSVNVDSDFRPNDESVATVERLETIVMGHWVPNAVPTVHRDEFTTPGQTPMTAAGHIAAEGDQVILTENPNTIHLPSYLPPWAEAMCMFRYYCDHIDFQYHVILPSRTEQQIQGIYNAVSRQEQIDLGHTALLFSIIASTAYYKLRCESSDHRSQTAAFLAGAALIQSNHIAYPTLEGLQATMVIGHCLSNTTLPSAVSSLFVHRLFLNQAVNMELHLLDCPRFGNERVSDGPERATLELKRRLWWDLVAYDW